MYSYVSTKSTYTYTYNTQIPMLDIKFCLLVHDRIYKNVFGLCPGIFFIHICIYMYASECDQTRAQIVFMSLFSTFRNSKWNLSTFRLSSFSTFRNSKRSLSTLRFFYVSKFSMKPFHFSTFWLFDIDFAYFLFGTMQLIPTQLPPPCPPHRAWTERGRTWVSLVSRHTEPEVSPSQKYFGNTLWWFNIAMENHHF
jgi:hypothetical protein